MLKVHRDQNGSFFIWLILIGAVVLWFMFTFAQRRDESAVSLTTEEATGSTVDGESVDGRSVTKSFKAVNGYENVRGKAVITEDEFSHFTVSASLALPSEFPGTHYGAKITGTGTTPEVGLGKLSKTSGVFSVQYSSVRPLKDYYQLVVFVDGEAATVEGKTLPHNVMVLDL